MRTLARASTRCNTLRQRTPSRNPLARAHRRIYYQVGDAATGQSPVMSFVSNKVGPTVFPWRTAFVADIGEADSANTTITRVLEANALGLVDHVVINGDISCVRPRAGPQALRSL